ncbi:ubiquitin carboxyl-terminal hydrolase MINDY-2 [Lampris incognitus]|uniref:ubiquitin carboxyl-terminal hydrolase MINDY-2 n=1 Tax=Lampris incognitus TaxID=2546036 RepID=UPI0024B6168C|nr:ubiquitin carboxyl-terminal hydrolase MINDY-2 [Lampris incognitus]
MDMEEEEANARRDAERSASCAAGAGAGGAGAGGAPGGASAAASDRCRSSEPPRSPPADVTCNNNSGSGAACGGQLSSDAAEVAEKEKEEADGSRSRSQPREGAGNGTVRGGGGGDSALAPGNNEGGATKLGDAAKESASSSPGGGTAAGSANAPRRLGGHPRCAGGAGVAGNVAPVKSEQISSEEPPSGSDPEPSPAAESRSLDSLDSFSNLTSCPSSEATSDGPEDRGLALALQSEYEKDGGKQSCSKERGAGQSIYHIKWIRWKEENTPVITQNENGPCPLLAIMNVLLLTWKVKMPPMMEIITAEQLMEYLGDYILDTKPKEISEAQRLNYEQNMSDAMAVLHKLQTGLDVNVKFTGVRVFEYTPECIVFDLLDIPLYHGWLVDPQMRDIVKAVGNCSYNQLVEKIISCKQSDNSELAGEGIVAEQFLNTTATQLTYHGLCELTSAVQEGELCVFFRNNHFSTMIKHKGQLYLLVTDQGFLTEEKVVWESLHNVDGDGNFCDSEFRLRPPSDPETVYRGQQDQIDQDYLMALSLQQEQQSQDLQWEQLPEGISDLELAKKLQEEEDRRASQYYQEQEQEQAAAVVAAQVQQGQQEPAGGDEEDRGAAGGAAPSPGKQCSAGESKPKKESKEKDKCVIL